MVQLIIAKAEPCFLELAQDPNGKNVVQKVLEVSSMEQFDKFFCIMKGHLESLSGNVNGTRAVQKLAEQSISREKVQEILEALPGALLEKLATSATGFHVVVRLLDSLPAPEAQELSVALCGLPERALALGKNQWGCCVVKKCMDKAGAAAATVSDAIAANALSLVQDPFGNYAVQHLVLQDQKPTPHIPRIVGELRGKIFELSLEKFSSNVLEKCLLHSSAEDRNKIIKEILTPPNQLPSEGIKKLLFHPYGNYVFQQALEVATEPLFSCLIEHSRQHVHGVLTLMQSETGAEEAAAPAEGDPAAGTITNEHKKRLVMRLVKKYPPYLEGLPGPVGDWLPEEFWAQPYCDPMAAYGGYPPDMWDMSYGAFGPFAYAPPMGGGKGRGGARSRSVGRGKAGKQRADAAGGAGAGNSGAGATVKVGRIVGFWPNYTVAYDEVPALSPPPGVGWGSKGGGGGKGQSKGKSKGKCGGAKGGGPAGKGGEQHSTAKGGYGNRPSSMGNVRWKVVSKKKEDAVAEEKDAVAEEKAPPAQPAAEAKTEA